MITPGSVIGIVGNGQLGRMSAIEAKKMGYFVKTYGPGTQSPAGQVADEEVTGAYDDIDRMIGFAKDCAVVTFEFENISHDALIAIQDHVPVRPAPFILETAQNRKNEKTWIRDNGFKTTPFEWVTNADQIQSKLREWGTKAVLKTTSFGYDGKGQVKIDKWDDSTSAWMEMNSTEAILEQFVDFDKEVSVIVARNEMGEVATYPVFENMHRNHILDVTIFPARVSDTIESEAESIGREFAEKIDLRGLLTIEFFLTKDGNLLINEIAPRPHNSGHVTFDCSSTSQFQQHIRSVCNLPLGNTHTYLPGVMINILGDSWIDGDPDWDELVRIPNVNLHLYNKDKAKPGRKMGHVTIVGGQPDEDTINQVRRILKIPPIVLL